MIHYFKFRQELFAPAAARDVYIKHKGGRGWPEECPPIRAANSFGFDLLANFDVTFIRNRAGNWRVKKDIVIESDFDYVARDDSPGRPLVQQYAWFWEKRQKIPHKISDDVFALIRNQVKLSSFLFLKTDPNEVLLMTEVPNFPRPWKSMTALIETDWYPASYPWHTVIELSPREKTITIKKGEPICRLIPLRRAEYQSKPMKPKEFEKFFDRGQDWLATHGRVEHEEHASAGVVDITRTYVKQQKKSRFIAR